MGRAEAKCETRLLPISNPFYVYIEDVFKNTPWNEEEVCFGDQGFHMSK